MRRISWRTVAGILYPPRCPLCGEILAGKRLACPECLEKEEPVGEPRCKKCGKPLREAEREYCLDCTERRHAYTEGRGVFLYKGGVKKAVLDLKYQGKRENARFLGLAMARLGEKEVRRWRPEALIPVPVHKRRRRSRGYNQAELLAKVCGEQWGIPVDAGLVRRRENTAAQKQLDPAERRRNLRSAFEAAGTAGSYERLLIIDDIYTTGSTVDAVAEALQGCGVKHIYFLTACIGAGD